MHGLEAYYDSEYDILVDSEEEDQIYEVIEGQPIYRTQHQVKILVEKIRFVGPSRLLDYGCAKSATIRTLVKQWPNVAPHLFDVSTRYIPFWERFTTPDRWAINELKPEWNAYFDAVTSFFSLEHIQTPARTVREIARLLAPGGYFYAVVPNVFANAADMIVVDHCNHFTESSLEKLISDAKLELIEIDARSHRGAFVVVAKKTDESPTVDRLRFQKARSRLVEISNYWNNAAARLRAHEATSREPAAIYGAGFYGAFIAANLCDPNRVRCRIDQNPFLQGKVFDGKTTVSPAQIPADVRSIFVGLNPVHAHRIISEIPALQERAFDYFFL